MSEMEKKTRDIPTGTRYGALVTTGPTFVTRKVRRVVCVCDCGNEKTYRVDHLLDGSTSSCGCQRSARQSAAQTVHGEWTTKLWGHWSAMRRRCNTKSTGNYETYGGRGIKVCDEWKDYLAFRSWALSHGYDDSLSLDRIDVNGDYCPENCRWATPREQACNRRNTIYVEFEGELRSLADLAYEYGADDELVYSRVVNLGWSVLKALTTPRRPCKRKGGRRG